MTNFKHEINFAKGRASFTVPIPSHSYVDRILRSSSYEELMWLFMNCESPAKEISESYAALHHLKRVARINDYTCIHVGDGATVRTAAMFTFFTKSNNLSIDPIMSEEKLSQWVQKYKV